jgi:hypothetical protein
VVCGLHGSQIREKAIRDGYVIMKLMDVFIPSTIITFVEIIGDPTIQ